MEKTIKLEETQSKFARIVIATATMDCTRFLSFQAHECRDIGATTELRVMEAVANAFGMQMTPDYSRWTQFLLELHRKAQSYRIDYPQTNFVNQTST